MAQGKPQGHAAEAEHGDKKHRVFSCWFVVIGLVVVGVVACLSVAVAVWSLATVNNIDNKCTREIEDFVDRLDEVNRTLYSFLGEQITEPNVGQNRGFPAAFCKHLFTANSSTPTGHYWVKASDNSAVRVDCDMTRSCGGVTGGWMRIAGLDFNNGSTLFPGGFQELSDSGTRTCGIQSSAATCVSVLFSASGVAYREVCGKIRCLSEWHY